MDATAAAVETDARDTPETKWPPEESEAESTQSVLSDPAAAKTPQQMFRWSSWVHVGPGAEGCEGVDEAAGKCECGNPLHFHGWLRLPNQFMHREIRDKAMAAKARRMRQLRDPDSDSALVLESELDEAARRGDEGKPPLIDEIIGSEAVKDYTEAIADVAEIDAPDQPADADEPVKLYANLEHDERRLAELRLMDEDQRPQEEYEELERHIVGHRDALVKRLEEIRAPRRQSLAEQDVNALVDQVRELRIAAEGNAAFHHTYGVWTLLLGTLRHPKGPRWFGDMAALEAAAPEVVEVLEDTLRDLEQTRNAAGN
jgi:hypothetical protein